MASVSVSRVVPASPEHVWQLVGGFHSTPDWLPYIDDTISLEGGRVRRLHISDGEVIIERMEEFNELERHCSYSIIEAPFPVTGYLSTLRVYPLPSQQDASEVVWAARFVPDGATEAEVIELFTGIFHDGLEALHSAVTR